MDLGFRLSFNSGYDVPVGSQFFGITAVPLNFGDGTSTSGLPMFTAVARSTVNDYIIGRYTTIHQYTALRDASGNPFNASANICCRMVNGTGLTVYTPTGFILEKTIIVLRGVPGGGSPVPTVFPTFTLLQGSSLSLPITAYPTQLDRSAPMVWRPSTPTEMTGRNYPGIEVDAVTGVLQWQTEGLLAGFYGEQVAIESNGTVTRAEFALEIRTAVLYVWVILVADTLNVFFICPVFLSLFFLLFFISYPSLVYVQLRVRTRHTTAPPTQTVIRAPPDTPPNASLTSSLPSRRPRRPRMAYSALRRAVRLALMSPRCRLAFPEQIRSCRC